jgi:hypothetical protein
VSSSPVATPSGAPSFATTALLRQFIPPAAATLEGPGTGRWNSRTDIISESRDFAHSKSHLVDVKFANTQISITGQTAVVRSVYALIVDGGARVDTTIGRATELFVHHGATQTLHTYRSSDGGKTWLLDAGIMEAKRIGK